MDLKLEALKYHEFTTPGKIEVIPSKACQTQKDLSLACTPGVAQPVPKLVQRAYEGKQFTFGREYIVPKPFDPRVIERESVAVAKQACAEGVAKQPIADWEAYRLSLRKRMEKYWTV
jgi:malic enzyme